MPAVVDQLTHAIQTFDKAIAGVLQYPVGSPKRWRAANDLWLSLSSKHRRIYREVCEENRLARDLVNKHGQALGVTKELMADKTLRQCLNIPIGAYHAITKADPSVFTLEGNAKKFFKEFPEYTTRGTF